MSVFLIAEAGSNFCAGPRDERADFMRACDLIDVAAATGCDAVKFQAFSPGKVYVPQAGAYGNLGDVNRLFDEDLVLPRAWLPDLADRCVAKGVEFMASVFSPEDADAVDPFVKRHKIASYELGHEELIRHVAKKGKPVILSTGAATLEEVDEAVFWARESGARDLTALHCVAVYPVEISQCNLLAMRVAFPPVLFGWSDHTLDPILAPVMAVALGASVIEKHYTISRSLPGPDHAFALTPRELAAMVRAVRQAEAALGGCVKRVQPCEEPLRAFATRACQAAIDLAPGDVVESGVNVVALRPGNRRRGMDARHLFGLRGRKVRSAVRAGDGVREEDVS